MAQHDDLVQALLAAQEKEVLALIRQKLAAGAPADEVLAECNRGMIELGNRFGRGECFIPELMFGGMIMKLIVAELAPFLGPAGAAQTVGKVVMGTVEHDVHDIGKDIVVMMLRGVGFEVIDLGVDVPPRRFAEAVRRHRPLAVGMSLLLTTCFPSVMATVDAIRQAGMRDGLKLMVGGAAASELLREKAGCDFYGKTAVDGVQFAGRLAGIG